MTETAFVFPGQGSQTRRPIEAFLESWPEAEAALERLEESAAIRELLECDDPEVLRETVHTQQSVLAAGIVVYEAVRERYGLVPDVVAGHSLGHITAATAAGVFTPDDAIALVGERGRAMATAEATDGPGTMLAVLFADVDHVETVLADYPSVAVASYNAPRQMVISGAEPAVYDAAEAIESGAGRARCVELEVASAFHSPVMDSAVDPFERRLEATRFADPERPVVSDVTGEVYEHASVARQAFADQLTAPVRWTAVTEALADRGIERVVELPPAGTLAGLLERSPFEFDVVALERPEQLDTLEL
ncbi:ACP S-malonyltransferase [Natronobiforma cellulositropha]|uniref:ACP S-malonyltransferase n=1 Tax=Natronobiforma cellulositropha TaxID=1679076 RepID=UPI0021D5849A|nr:ACP S-malonyltransferase [Natronobiforma cellulositropha]